MKSILNLFLFIILLTFVMSVNVSLNGPAIFNILFIILFIMLFIIYMTMNNIRALNNNTSMSGLLKLFKIDDGLFLFLFIAAMIFVMNTNEAWKGPTIENTLFIILSILLFITFITIKITMSNNKTSSLYNLLKKNKINGALILIVFIIFVKIFESIFVMPGPYHLQSKDCFVSRDTLVDVANKWLDQKGPLATGVRETINGIESPVLPPKPGFTNRVFFCDTQKGQVSVWANNKNNLYQARLAVRNNLITEIEVYEVYGFPHNMNALKAHYVTRDKLISIVNTYFNGLKYPGNPVPFDTNTVRYEMGFPLSSKLVMCNAEHVFFGCLFRDVTDRRYVVDEENGVIIAYIFFEMSGKLGGMTAVEIFKVINGYIYEIHAYWKFKFGTVDPGWEDGGIIKRKL